jgi:hypothetical protein
VACCRVNFTFNLIKLYSLTVHLFILFITVLDKFKSCNKMKLSHFPLKCQGGNLEVNGTNRQTFVKEIVSVYCEVWFELLRVYGKKLVPETVSRCCEIYCGASEPFC